MLGDASPTPYDLRFRLLGFPVRVHPLFWLIMALLGDWTLRAFGPLYLVLWVLCGFVSILVHELGHAVAMRRFGFDPQIVLHGFGGAAVAAGRSRSSVRRLIIAGAGPAAGFALLGVVIAVGRFAPLPDSELLQAVLLFLFLMNLFWNLLNLLPIWPLDGGHVVRELCTLGGVRNPEKVSLTISLATAGGLAVLGALVNLRVIPEHVVAALPYTPSWMMTIFMGFFAYQSWELLQHVNRQTRWDDADPWRR